MRWSVHGSAGVLLNEQLTGAHPRPLSTGCGSGGDRPPRGPSRYGRLDESSTGGSGGRPPWGRGRQAAAGRQAGLTIGPNHASLSPQIDHGARRRYGGGGGDACPSYITICNLL
jgi:hypothetical protein